MTTTSTQTLFFKKYIWFVLFFLIINILNTEISYAQTATLDKAVDLTAAASGENLKYSLTYGCSSLDADCIGAVLIDTLPPEVTYMSSTPAIVTGSAGQAVITPVYDGASHTVTWDFRTIVPELGLPDGASGTVEILVNIKPGITPNGITILNHSELPTDNAGTPIDSATTIVEGVSPQWSITKEITSGPIYHDHLVDYEVSVCSDSPIGNLHLLPGTVVTDSLPPGAVFVSASGGGTHSGGMPGAITWMIPDTMKIDDPCRVYTITVTYPVTDPNNQTGLDMPIHKLNLATLDATALGGEPVMDSDSVHDPLLPPVFMVGINKETGNGNGATPEGTTNKFIIGVSNNSTTAVDNFIITDAIPPQADITEIHVEPSMGDTVLVDIRVQLNNSGVWIDFQSDVSTIAESEFDVTTIPGWDIDTSYVSQVEYNYGTVEAGFNTEMQLIFEPAYPIANDSTTTQLDTAYTNSATATYIRPLDAMPFQEMSSTTFCVVNGLAARIDPDKVVEINYVDTPAGDPTTGNPYFKGARVKYTLHIGNDGSDGSDDDDEITADSSFTTISNPIGADLLPAEMLYENASWTIVNNTSDEVWDNAGTNPSFELIDDFNGTGKTLLRWTFTGDLDPGEGLDICFNAFIRDTVAAGTIVDNGFAMTSPTDIYCDEGDCEPAATNPDLNNYFGDAGNPATLLPGITEMCEKSVTFEVADSTSVPVPTKAVISAGPYAPDQSAPAELGLATDTVSYSIGLCNLQAANYMLPDPVLVDLLPEELTLIPGSVALVENTTGLPFQTNPNGTTNPVFEVVDDFLGTGRQLLRWNFEGEVPINTCMTYTFKTLIKLGSGGLVDNEPYVAPASRVYECTNGGLADDMDMDGDGNTIGDTLCMALAPVDFLIPEIRSMGAQKFARGAKDTVYIASEGGILGRGCTYPEDSIFWAVRIFNPGNVTLTDGVMVDIFPYIGDSGVQLTETARESEFEPYLVEPIISPSPNIDIYYSQSQNPCRPEIDPEDEAGCLDDWTTTPPADLSTVKAVKFDFVNEDIEPAEEFWFEIKMLAPDSINMSPGTAWNSMARNANEVPAQEPNKVGITIQGYDLALRKQLKSGQSLYAAPGQDVDFTITLINQSSDTVQNVTVTDYIPAQMILNDGTWTDEGGNVASYLLAAPLAPNDSIDIDITLTVSATAMTGDELDNFAEISDFEDLMGNHPPDWDSRPDTNPNNDAGGVINSPADDVTSGHGRGAVPDTDAASDEDDHDGARIIVCPDLTQNSAPDQEVCTDNLAALQDIKIPTNADVSQNIKFVYYNSQQADTMMYDGMGTDLLTTNPVADTVTLPVANIPTVVGTYYIYAIFDPIPSEPNCRPFDEVMVVVNPPIVANAGADVEICEGDNTDLTAVGTGGNEDYSYEWSTSATTATINVSPTITTDYFVTITDSSDNCSAMDTVTVTVNPLPNVDAGIDEEACINELVTLNAIPSGGTPAYTYNWSNGDTNASTTVMVTTPTTFTVTLTDSKTCTDIDTVFVSVPVADAGLDQTICYGDTTMLTATGGVSYNWSNGDSGATISVSPIVTTEYIVTITDANTCTDMDTVTVNVNAQPDFMVRDTTVCATERLDLTSLVTDYGDIQLPMWYETVAGGTLVGLPTSVSPSTMTTYVLVGENSNTCRDTTQLTVNINELPVISVSNDTTICRGTMTTISANVTGGTPNYTFSWNNGLTNSQGHVIMPAVSTIYRVTVTDDNACTDSDEIAITVNEIQTTISQTCFDNDTGGNTNDDYFSINITATNTNTAGASNQYEILYNGAILATATYGTVVTLEWLDVAQTMRFLADGVSSYDLTIRDVDLNTCATEVTGIMQANCSVCPALICLPVKVTKK